ncbi:MAG: integral rane sensor signal transduction histidine kinase [Candidatus Solibacter sp.]|nr:integral rane sensor signal transduction histidine kinase [Candidatus Solibacter sp.]
MTGKIFLKLIVGVFALLLLALVTVDYFATNVAQENYVQNLTQQLTDKGRMLALMFPAPESVTPEQARKMAQAVGGRITVVRADGKVLLDTDANAAEMENHRSRKEIREAFEQGKGSEIRQSATIGVSFLYVAVPAAGGGSAIRIAFPLSEINRQIGQIRGKILASTSAAFLPAILIAAILARFISRRLAAIMAHAGELARGNFRARLPEVDSSEFGQLAQTLNETAENLQQTVAQLQHEHAELEKLERIRKDFVINVSHELRTPLASIQGYTETLIDGALADPDHNMRFLGIIRHNAERLARLTEDLLTLSRVEQKRQKFEFDLHSANSLIHDAFELVGPIARKSLIELVEERAPDDVMVCCDSEAVSQILSNLLDNAIKYTPAGGKITVGAKALGTMVEFFVRDTGAGIPEEDLPRLFERFYRVDKARSRELGGTGLGLSIVKHLVAAHNGTTRVESVLGQGSTFFFTLPVDEAVLGEETLNPEFTAS